MFQYIVVNFFLNYLPLDKHYWRNYGTEDLKSRLALKPNERTAKNVIIFIGDGMGVNTHTAARIYKGQKNGGFGEEAILAWEKFPYTGQSKTYNTDHQVPDSAGTATAMFSGVSISSIIMVLIHGFHSSQFCSDTTMSLL